MRRRIKSGGKRTRVGTQHYCLGEWNGMEEEKQEEGSRSRRRMRKRREKGKKEAWTQQQRLRENATKGNEERNGKMDGWSIVS